MNEEARLRAQFDRVKALSAYIGLKEDELMYGCRRLAVTGITDSATELQIELSRLISSTEASRGILKKRSRGRLLLREIDTFVREHAAFLILF